MTTTDRVAPALGGTITTLLIVLKITGTITLPWVWVLAPIWLAALILMTALGMAWLILREANR